MMSHFGLVCCLWPFKGGVELWLNAFFFDPAGQGEPRAGFPLDRGDWLLCGPFQRASGCVCEMHGDT